MRQRRLLVSTICLALLAGLAQGAGRRKPRQYKRSHRKAWTCIDQGRYQAAIDVLAPAPEAPPDDAETLYLLAIAHAHRKDFDQATAHVRKALQAGLPLERFLAGPRDWTKPLTASAKFQELLKKHGGPLVHGPMLGSVTDTTATFWVRTPREATVGVHVQETRNSLLDFAKAPRATAKAGEDGDWTAVVKVGGLKPGGGYDYGISVDGKPATQHTGTFHTLPKPGSKGKFTVAFGGGAGYVPANERMWDVILRHRPAALLMLGDNVYIDTPKSPNVQRYLYYRRQSRPEWRRLVARTPVYAIYDDHDFGTNDCVPGHQTFEPAWKPKVWKVFKQNWANPAYGGGPRQPGCWFDFRIGDVHVILLDGRYYRSLKKKSMLGPVQKTWLLETLRTSPGTFKVLASPVPWAPGTKGKSRDTWDGFPDEREEIFAFIEKHNVDGVVLLSADRHRSDAWKIERRNGYDLYEFESSRLTNQHVHPRMSKALFSYNKKQSFGRIDFDTTAPNPTVTYRIINIENEEVYKLTLTKSQLTHK